MEGSHKQDVSPESAISSSQEEIAFGALLGAACGDAAGAPLEHLGRKPEIHEVESALSMDANLWNNSSHISPLGLSAGSSRMLGGCAWAIGQCTDDTEMTISLARGLAACKEDFSIESIAQEYGKWVKSGPPDMGITTGASIGCVLKGARNSAFQKYLQEVGYAEAMRRASAFDCKGGTSSQSNGSLMRCVPFGIYGHQLTDEEIAYMAIQDGLLSHPNPCCIGAVTCYSIAIAHLLNHPGDRHGAYRRAKAWVDGAGNEMATVAAWLEDAEANVNVPYYPAPGWVKIGFIHAFRHLLLGTSYEDALKETLLGGGDTDTNACIVGGLIGACYGVDAIPSKLKSTVRSCDTRQGKERPEWLHPKHLEELSTTLLGLAPSKITLANNEEPKEKERK